jgi:hypothetical protein
MPPTTLGGYSHEINNTRIKRLRDASVSRGEYAAHPILHLKQHDVPGSSIGRGSSRHRFDSCTRRLIDEKCRWRRWCVGRCPVIIVDVRPRQPIQFAVNFGVLGQDRVVAGRPQPERNPDQRRWQYVEKAAAASAAPSQKTASCGESVFTAPASLANRRTGSPASSDHVASSQAGQPCASPASTSAVAPCCCTAAPTAAANPAAQPSSAADRQSRRQGSRHRARTREAWRRRVCR